jgi:release factor glutamine methyltransferase
MRDMAGTSGQATLAAAIRDAASELRSAGVGEPGNDARRLAGAVLGLSAAEFLSVPGQLLTPDQTERLSRCVARRAAREPVSRILGEREFYGRSFAITPATLDPRPDSETLIEVALGLAADEDWLEKPLRVLDVGTGSGCLLVSLLAELPRALGTGTDVSEAALHVARTNARRLGVADRASWVAANLLNGINGTFDLLICNPPYIASGQIDQLEPEVRCFEPRAALDGGPDGLRFFHLLAEKVAAVVPNGWVVLEVGHDQADAVASMLSSGGAEPGIYRDLSRHRRCVAMRSRN